MEFPRVFITGWECRECPRKLKTLKLFLHEEKDDAGKEVCVVCCVLCHASGGEQGEPIRITSRVPHAPSPMPLEESKELQVSMPAMTLSQCPHAPKNPMGLGAIGPNALESLNT